MVHDVQMGKNIRKSYSRIKEVLEMPNLIEIQQDSYDWFLREGLKEVFDYVNPITDYTGNLKLEFVDYHVDVDNPKYPVEECKERDATYAAPLRVKVRLTSTTDQNQTEIKEADIFMGDFYLDVYKRQRYTSTLSEMSYNYGKDTYTFSVLIPEEAKELITLRQKVRVSIVASSIRYDTMIPKNALYSDMAGSYIFTLVENPQNGEWFARKSYVNVADEDSFYYALEEKYKYTVIVSSSKPISDGTRVRTK